MRFLFIAAFFVFSFFYKFVFAEIFKQKENFRMEQFLKFDITKYNFEDHIKILGKNSKKWNGNPNDLAKDQLDYRSIDVFINNNPYKLRLSKYKDGITLALFNNVSMKCKDEEKIVPKKYIKKENYYTYENTQLLFQKPFIKSTKTSFSVDIGLSRIHFFCYELFYVDLKERTTIFTISNKPKIKSKPKIQPIKTISCINQKIFDTVRKKWLPSSDGPRIFHLVDSDKELLLSNYTKVRENLIYNNDKIHTLEEFDLGKAIVLDSGNKLLKREYIIDRINGLLTINAKVYESDLNKTYDVTMKSECNIVTEQRKF